MCSCWQPASVVPYFTVSPTSAFPRVAHGLVTPTLQHSKRNWLPRLPAVVIFDRSNTVNAVQRHWPTHKTMICCTHKHTQTHRRTFKHTSTYLCGSCVHVSGRPNRGTAVDSTHLLHKCKDLVPAFCQKETKTHKQNCDKNTLWIAWHCW